MSEAFDLFVESEPNNWVTWPKGFEPDGVLVFGGNQPKEDEEQEIHDRG